MRRSCVVVGLGLQYLARGRASLLTRVCLPLLNVPAVLDILKGNADQLFQLKQGVVAEKLVRVLAGQTQRSHLQFTTRQEEALS